jgi:hypothetical protein
MTDPLDSNAAIGRNCDQIYLRIDIRDNTGRHLLTVYIPAGNDYAAARANYDNLTLTSSLSV